MKKILLSSILVVAFAVYALQQRLSGSGSNIAANYEAAPGGSGPDIAANYGGATSSGSAPAVSNIAYKDGQYTGISADAYYGSVQVKATIQNGKIVDVQFLDHPSDRNTSIQINNRAMPVLKSEAISAQSAKVNAVSGATDTSHAFMQSLSSALNQAV